MVIPYGDHTVSMGAPIPQQAARAKLGLSNEDKLCLVFGTVSPYKGIDELLEFWVAKAPPARLLVVGPILNSQFAEGLRSMAGSSPSVDLRIGEQWLDDEALRLWLSAADCALFNYREIFTSGAASLARSYGVPVVIPSRLEAADLHEPHPLVFRFDSPSTDLMDVLDAALSAGCSYDMAAQWRHDTRWEQVAQATVAAYRAHLE